MYHLLAVLLPLQRAGLMGEPWQKVKMGLLLSRFSWGKEGGRRKSLDADTTPEIVLNN